MKITKNALAAFAATFLETLCLFANGQPKTFGKFPISLPSADSPAIKTRAYVVAAQPEDPQGLEAAAKSALSADVKSLGLSASDARRAMAFKKLARPDASKISATAKLGDFYAVFPAATAPMPKGRPNINFMVFQKDADGYKWLPSFNDPLLQVMADGAAGCEKFGGDVAAFTESDAKTVKNLTERDLPFLQFANGAFVSLEADPQIDSREVAKFYRHAQNIFYSWKIKEYGQFLTPRTKAAFDSQFGSMSEAEKKKALGDYFAWGKKYLKALDASPATVMVFLRTKDGEKSKPDFAYILKGDDGLKIAVLTDSKTPLEAFMGKYLLTDAPYEKNISAKFEAKK